jgi:hypothetical protein
MFAIFIILLIIGRILSIIWDVVKHLFQGKQTSNKHLQRNQTMYSIFLNIISVNAAKSHNTYLLITLKNYYLKMNYSDLKHHI